MKAYHINSQNMQNAQGLTLCAISGALTGLAANDVCFALRNVGPKPLLLSSLTVLFASTVEATAAGAVALSFAKAVGFSAIPAGGAPLARNFRYKRTQPIVPPALVVSDVDQTVPTSQIAVNISDAAAVTGGTFLAPAMPFAAASAPAINGVTATTGAVAINQIWTVADGLPEELGPDEGIIGAAIVAFPTALVGRLTVMATAHRPG